MKLLKKRMAFALTFLIVLTFSAPVNAVPVKWPNINLPDNTEIISISGKKGQEIKFDCSDLEFKLNLPRNTLLGASITGLPDRSTGGLFLNGAEIKEYRHLSRQDINSMVFIPAENISAASITIIPETQNSVAAVLSINLSEKTNAAPIVENRDYATQINMPFKGKFFVYDSDEDQVSVKIMSAPQKGGITVNGTSFVYEPFYGEKGNDRFTFVCIDSSGNYSREGIIDITIETGTGFLYADMANNPEHYSAVKLSEEGIFTGDRIGNSYFFHPEKQVTRAELLIAVISAANYESELVPCVNSGMRNENEIAYWLKPYVKLAKEKGIIVENQFKPEQIPSLAEAVLMIDRAAGMENVDKYNLNLSDIPEIPNWALQSYINLAAYKMLNINDGYARPNDEITRENTAGLLWQLRKYKINNE